MARTSNNSLSFFELASLTAAVFALNALAIDMILPALGMIGNDLGIRNDNDRQLLIGVYLFANGFAQLPFGPIVDRIGRRPVLLFSLSAYVMCNLLSVFAPSFLILLITRVFQGIATAGARVSVVAIVRDNYEGRQLARVISFAITIFMAAPIIAPALGQAVLAFGPWRWIFWALFFYGLAIFFWSFIRAPRRTQEEKREAAHSGGSTGERLSFQQISARYLEFLTDRCAMGYTITSAFCYGALFGFINSAEQLYLELFDLGAGFGPAFAMAAVWLAVATFLNGQVVERFGMRLITHVAVVGFFLVALIHFVLTAAFGDSFIRFMVFMAPLFFALGLIGPNTAALALDRMGHIAGYAAAANGSVSTMTSAILGLIVGRQFDGSSLPITAGFAVLGFCSLCIIYWTERGQLFRSGPNGRADGRQSGISDTNNIAPPTESSSSQFSTTEVK
ncbi:MAG: multidrug effflux MFS transporter [Pseudomonadota bacterium]